MNRRTQCVLVGRRADRLSSQEAAKAWFHLAGQLAGMDIPFNVGTPKYQDLLKAIRAATIYGRQETAAIPPARDPAE